MTGHQINSLVGDLVQMAQAMEKLPQVERQVTELEHELEARARANNDLRESNDILREHIGQLETKIKEVTQERDDASFRVLETEDKLAAWERLAKAFSVDVSALVKAQTPEVIEPTKPEPIYTASGFEGQSASPPSINTESQLSDVGLRAETLGNSDPYPRNERGQFAGQGADHPMGAAASQPVSVQNTMESPSANEGQAVVGTHEANKPFAGKLYINVPGFHSLSAWLEGGGSEAAYHWRQGQPLPDGYHPVAG